LLSPELVSNYPGFGKAIEAIPRPGPFVHYFETNFPDDFALRLDAAKAAELPIRTFCLNYLPQQKDSP
jgi:hypothetical protein